LVREEATDYIPTRCVIFLTYLSYYVYLA
jgi:hypothetical protein